MYLLTTNSPPQGNGCNVLHLDCHAEAFRHKKRTPQFCGVLLYKLLKSLISAVLFLFLRTSGNQSFTGSMAVNSGVEHADAARAEKAILKELDDLRSGPITAEELEDCRRSLLSGMAGIEDTLGGIETWYYMEVLRGGPVQTPDDARAALQAVTEEDVRTVLRQLTLSVSYLLTREEESAHA